MRLFVVDAVAFRQDWEANGPTVPGLDPMDATDRLRKFQQLFEVGIVAGWRCGAVAGGTHPAGAEGAARRPSAALCTACLGLNVSHYPSSRLCCLPLQVRRRKWDSYSSGEELFGLPVTQVRRGRCHGMICHMPTGQQRSVRMPAACALHSPACLQPPAPDALFRSVCLLPVCAVP